MPESRRIIVLIPEDRDAGPVAREIAEADASFVVDVVSRFSDMSAKLKQDPYCGVMIDFTTHLKAAKEDKKALAGVEKAFPTVLFKTVSPGGIRLLTLGRAAAVDSVDDFVKKECRPFTPRILRRHDRRSVVLSATLSRDMRFSEGKTEHSVCVNLSAGGCFFVLYSDWGHQSYVWIQFREMTDLPPIRARVIRQVRWGEKGQLPGIGVAFQNIGPEHLKKLQGL